MQVNSAQIGKGVAQQLWAGITPPILLLNDGGVRGESHVEWPGSANTNSGCPGKHDFQINDSSPLK